MQRDFNDYYTTGPRVEVLASLATSERRSESERATEDGRPCA
ncbi:hypothetical protein [Saccharopolyspora phatthalungensis]|uniref:Uncharacterized protein n=1 Tax=Saccharopolyspora phatthalungensis TaxID=664693 RepID=A0A840QG00_9PSEU|nr:hypothetical protein [Saccharopolyspora phatthalungensis]MBB5159017.1 hypothetical protein [Saccharopolyspora phatthalungensis]